MPVKSGLLLLLAALAVGPGFAADFEIIPIDDPNTGFNDSTPVAPLVDNPGVTLGEQRINVLQRALEIWGQHLDTNVTITVDAQMVPLTCDANSGSAVLASAGATHVVFNFPGAVDTTTLYPPSLANTLAGSDQSPGISDLQVNVNLNIDADPPCQNLFGGWYYGLDFNNGAKRDLLATLLHELGHGLGFQSFVDSSTGGLFNNRPDVFTSHIEDLQDGRNWLDMNASDRLISRTNDPHLVWNGENVTAAAPAVLTRNSLLLVRVDGPAELAGKYSAFEAAFGALIANDLSGELVVEATNACAPIVTDLTGKIALIDRGDCQFSDKVLAAQNAGAIAVVIVNNDDSSPLFLMQGGDVAAQVTIPSVFITMADGNELKAAASTVSLTLGRDPDPAGMNGGKMRLHAPLPFSGGSSVSHFTEEAAPELLMEPNSSDELSDDLDLTIALFKDMGWPIVGQQGAVFRHLYPWLSFREGEFASTLVANNVGSTAADVTFRARRGSGEALTASAQIPPLGFLAAAVDELFEGLETGSGFTVEMETDSADVAGRWLTTSLQAASGSSPAQGVAAPLAEAASKDGKRSVGNSLLYGYMPNTGSITSAPVVVNAGTATTAVTLYFYDKDGDLLLEDTTSITALEPYRPFALPVSLLLPGLSENITMIAHSSGQPITGAVFIFDSVFNEPAIGTAQVVDFKP